MYQNDSTNNLYEVSNGINSFLECVREQLEPYAEMAKLLEQNMKQIFSEISEKFKPLSAFRILAEHQFTYWKPLSSDDIETIVTSNDVDAFLALKIKDKSFINYNEICDAIAAANLLSETNEHILLESLRGIESEEFNLALAGITAVIDGTFSKVTGDDSTGFKSRINKIQEQIQNLTEEEWEKLNEGEITAFGFYITWEKTMDVFWEFCNFKSSQDNQRNLNRNCIAHGRKTSLATELDCCKLLNALYGLIYFGSIQS